MARGLPVPPTRVFSHTYHAHQLFYHIQKTSIARAVEQTFTTPCRQFTLQYFEIVKRYLPSWMGWYCCHPPRSAPVCAVVASTMYAKKRVNRRVDPLAYSVSSGACLHRSNCATMAAPSALFGPSFPIQISRDRFRNTSASDCRPTSRKHTPR